MTALERTGTEELGGGSLKFSGLEPVMVEVVDGPSRGAKARLDAGTLRVGSGEDCELLLVDRSVSRRHLSLELLPGSVRVRDLESRNGTFYLGARIREAVIPIGGSVTAARTTLRILPVSRAMELSQKDELCGLVGRSPAMRRLYTLLERVGPQESTVLIHGETGSGKEQVARTLHALSEHKDGPFVVFDCASVHPELVESELFGHARGAFTGAVESREGALEQAAGGTLFLDEIGELPLSLQPKLLRALGQREFHRVGERVPRTMNARVVAATHRDLWAEAKENRFRMDLYFRLAVTVLEVPPLRDRPEDIPLLAKRFARATLGADLSLSPATLASLQCARWPGNVRELQNAVQRVLALGGAAGEVGSGEEGEEAPVTFKEARDELLHRFESDYLRALLEKHGGNVAAAARESGVSRTQFYRLLRRHQLQ